MARGKQTQVDNGQVLKAPAQEGSQAGLRDEVKQALRKILNDKLAPAAARASAARTLLEYFDDTKRVDDRKRGAELTLGELDEQIAQANAALFVK